MLFQTMYRQGLYLLNLISGLSIVLGIPLSDFYPYGQGNGDRKVPTNDDGSSPKVEISTSFPYFNQLFHSLYVNTNGDISFSSSLSTYTPHPFPLSGNSKIVAPYWCDIDTRRGGVVWYYETNNQMILRNASQNIREIFPDQSNFDAAWVFVATWDNVAFYGANAIGKTKRNTFQCLLITNGRHSFAIFLYNRIEWTTGTASNGNANTGLGGTPAQVGFDAGDGHNFLAINESRTDRVINVTKLSNVDIPGKFVFRLDTEIVTGSECTQETGGALTIFPRFITMFGGTELSIGGPCIEEGDKIEIEFQHVSVRRPCSRVSKTIAKCIAPMANITGDVKVTLYIQRASHDVPASPNGIQSIKYTGLSSFVNPVDTKKSSIHQIQPDTWALGRTVTIGWNILPFEADLISIEQFSVGNLNGTEVKLISDGYITRNLSVNDQTYTFLLQTPRSAVAFRIHREPSSTDYIDNVLLVPSVWSDIYIPRPLNSAVAVDTCIHWAGRDDQLRLSISRDNIEVCPCNINQAQLDIARFVADPLCQKGNNGRSKCTFSPDAEQCFRMVFPGRNGNDNQCCYDNNGNLIETNGYVFGGFGHRYHYKGGPNGNAPHLSNVHGDIVPFMYCCQFLNQDLSGFKLCEEFLTRRPASRCKGYKPPWIASIIGDPHMVTLDGLHYTFNGVGEFVLVTDQIHELSIQARMEQFKDEQGNAMQASVITSIAMQCNSSEPVVEIRLNEIRLVDVLVNGQLVDFTDTDSIGMKGTTIVSSRRNNVTDLIWISVTCGFPNVALNVTAVRKMINFKFIISGQVLRGKLSGLLGNFNGRTYDDLLSKDGVFVPINASLNEIHYNFGLSWMTNASESLFTYPIGKTHDSYQRKDFDPVFNPIDRCSINNVTGVCGNDPACQFDLCTTNDAGFASITKQASDEMNVLLQFALPACGLLPRISHGNWNYSGQSASLECDPGYNSNSTSSIICGEDGEWGIINIECEKSCDILTNVSNGYWNYSGNSASLVCYSGFSPNGSTTVMCGDDGKWNSINTACIKSCGALGNVPNGHWNYSGDSAYLVCKPGYSPGGTTTVQCGENGEWGIIVAICANDDGSQVVHYLPIIIPSTGAAVVAVVVVISKLK